MLREVLYLRISSQEQKESGISIQTQEQILRDASKRDGTGTIIKVFKDVSKSAYLDDEGMFCGLMEKTFRMDFPLDKREQFIEMIKWAYEKKIDVIRFVKWDRFARVLELQEGLVRLLTRLNIELKPEEPTHKVVRRMLGTINEGESDKTSERVNWAFDEKFRKNLFTKPFYGYEGIRDRPEGAIVGFKINEREARIIKEVFKSRIDKEESKDVCKRLGISYKTYNRILQRKEYTGIVIRDGVEKEVPELSIITKEMWNKATSVSRTI